MYMSMYVCIHNVGEENWLNRGIEQTTLLPISAANVPAWVVEFLSGVLCFRLLVWCGMTVATCNDSAKKSKTWPVADASHFGSPPS